MTDKSFFERDEERRMEKAKEDKNTIEPFEQAEKDIEKDPDMDMDDKEDLDEGELARKEGHP